MHPIIGIIRELICNIKNSNKHILIYWIPSHCNVPGNMKSDKLAKNGCILPQISFNFTFNIDHVPSPR